MGDMKRNSRYNKEGKGRPVSSSAVVRLIIWSIVLCLLVGVFSLAMLLEWGSENMFRIHRYDYDDEGYSVGNGSTDALVTDIAIDWVAGSVTLLAVDGEEVRVIEDYDGQKEAHRLRWRVQKGELSVKYCRPAIFGGVDTGSKNLTVEIPRSMLEGLTDINVSAVSAVQNISLSARELEIRTVSGRVDVKGDYSSLDVETVSGAVNFDGSFREGSLNGVSGAWTIRLREQADELDMETVSGGMRVILPKETSGFHIDAESVSGNVDVRGFDKVYHSSEYHGANSWGDGRMEISMESVSGKLTVEVEDEADD